MHLQDLGYTSSQLAFDLAVKEEAGTRYANSDFSASPQSSSLTHVLINMDSLNLEQIPGGSLFSSGPGNVSLLLPAPYTKTQLAPPFTQNSESGKQKRLANLKPFKSRKDNGGELDPRINKGGRPKLVYEETAKYLSKKVKGKTNARRMVEAMGELAQKQLPHSCRGVSRAIAQIVDSCGRAREFKDGRPDPQPIRHPHATGGSGANGRLEPKSR